MAYKAAGIDPPGSQPIPLKMGTMSREVEVTEPLPTVSMELELDQDLSDFDQASITSKLARMLGISERMIRLHPRAGSVIVGIDLASLDVTAASDIVKLLIELDDSDLTNAFGVASTRISDVLSSLKNMTYVKVKQPPCPTGHW